MTTQIDLMKMINFANNLEGEEQNFYSSTMEEVEQTLLSIAFDPSQNIGVEKILPHIPKHEIDHLNLLTLETFITSEFQHPQTKATWNAMDVFLQSCGKDLSAYEKKYFKGLRSTKTSIYEVIEINEGHSLTLRDLLAKDHATVVVQEPEPANCFPRWSILATKLVPIDGETRMRSAILQFNRQQVENVLGYLKDIEQFMQMGLGSLDRSSRDAIIQKAKTNMIAAAWLNGFLPSQGPKNYVNRDGETVKLCKLRFPLTASREKIAKRLDEMTEFQQGEKDKWLWLVPLERAETHQEHMTAENQSTFVQLFAGMTLKTNELIVDTTSEQRATQVEFFLKEKLEGLVGEPFSEIQNIDNLDPKKVFDQSKNQKLSATQLKEMHQSIDGYYKIWMNRKTPTLNNLPPKDAVQTPEGRKKVISLLKDLEISFNQPFRTQKVKNYDSSWVFEDLGIKANEL